MEQRSPEWFAHRAGKLTASSFDDAETKTKNGAPSASRKNLIARLVCERLTGQCEESYTNAAMQWGVDKEPEARSLYELMRDVEVAELGFADHPTIKNTGASPDGLVGDDGLIEIKCPNTATHIEYLLSKEAPAKYISQMQWQMACTGRKWCDFVSYDPRLPANLQLFVVRVNRDDARIAEMESVANEVLAEVDSVVTKLREM